jgi:MipA family protein
VKKILFLLSTLTLTLFAKDDVFVGLGPYFQTQPYKDADPVVLATPVIFFDNSLFYIRWTRVGMYFYGQRTAEGGWGLSITAQPQVLGYYDSPAMTQLNHRNPTPVLAGMPAHESGWEGGLAAAYKHGDYFAELLLMQEIVPNSNGIKVRIELGKSFSYGHWYFVPSFLAVWLSQPFTNYYFGVPASLADTTLNRPAYTPGAALNLAAQTYIKYDLSEHWHLLANLRADRFADAITDSPLSGKRYMYSGMFSVLYSFNLFGEDKAVFNPPKKGE